MEPILKLAEAAAKKTRNFDILELSNDDILEAIVTHLDVKKYYQQFDHLFESRGVPAIPWKHNAAKESLQGFLNSVDQNHEQYGDMLDVFIDGYIKTKSKDFDQRIPYHKLGAYLDNRQEQNEVWLEVGAGYTGLGLIDELNKQFDGQKITYILNDFKRPDVTRAIQRYADRLGMANVMTLHADAGTTEFKEGLQQLLGNRKINQIRANQVLHYVDDRNQFFDSCDSLLKEGGKIHLKEFHPIQHGPFSSLMMEKIDTEGWLPRARPDGTQIVMKYDPETIAHEKGFGFKERFEKKDQILNHYMTLEKKKMI